MWVYCAGSMAGGMMDKFKIFIIVMCDFIHEGYHFWAANIRGRDLDGFECCDGRNGECGCEGRTIRDSWLDGTIAGWRM